MRCVVEPGRSLRLFRLAILASIAVTAAACSSETHRFDSNPFNSRSQGSGGDVTNSVPQRSSSVQSQPLPPPQASRPETRPAMTGTSGGSRGMASWQPGQGEPEVTGAVPAHTPAAPPRTAARSGWNWEGGTAVTVQPGDTIDSITRRYGVPASAIAEANNLPNGSTLRPGQRLIIPKYDVTGSTVAPRPAAPVRPEPRVAAPATSGPHVHIIAPGETLMKLSRQYNKPLSEIARANNIPPYTMVKVGDRIVIPDVRGRSVAQAPRPAAPAVQQPPQVSRPAPQPAQKVVTAPATVPAATANVVTPPAQNPEPPKAKQEVTAAMPSFRWPVNGRVIQGFGPRPTGAQNDGINVSVPEGTPIKAAEDGVVAYAGNELKTYGNLVLIRHSNGYVTAYAHASEILVKRDDRVKRGQVIAKSGQTGSVSGPQVHFEIRKGSTPVDPAPFLRGGNG